MLYTKQKALEYIESLNDEEVYILNLPLSKRARTIAQNDTFYRCFTLIGNKMGIDKEEVKMNCLKALFGVTTSKFGGVTYENAIKPHTSKLDIEEARRLIDSLIVFGRQLGLGEMVTSRELQDLFIN